MNLDTIVCMDALEFMATLPDQSVDAVITDPPYGLYGNTIIVRPDTGGLYNRINEPWDHIAPVDWMSEVQRVIKPKASVLIFGGRESIYKFGSEGIRLGWRLVNDITWFKPDATPNFSGRMLTESTERLLWFCPSGSGWYYDLTHAKSINCGINFRDVWTFRVDRGNRLHPSQKPLALMERIVSLFTPTDAVVLDCFAGSGTTLVAARNLGRHFIGCDSSPEYVELAKKRLAKPWQPALLEG